MKHGMSVGSVGAHSKVAEARGFVHSASPGSVAHRAFNSDFAGAPSRRPQEAGLSILGSTSKGVLGAGSEAPVEGPGPIHLPGEPQQ